MQAKRKAVVGDADPAFAASALGILLAHAHIDREQHDQALEYRKLWCAQFGSPGFGNSFGTEASERRLAELKKRLDRLERRLTHPQRETLRNVAVFDIVPNWFFAHRLGLRLLDEDHDEQSCLLSALNALLERETPHVDQNESLDTTSGHRIKREMRESELRL